MTTINSVIELQIILALLMICGIVLTKKRVLTADGRKCLTDLLINLILPCNIINSFLIDLSSGVLIASLEVLLIALGIQILCWLGGKVLFQFAEPGKKKVLQYATICSNAGFMGNPIIEGIYGQEGLLYASVCHASDLQNSWNLGAGDRRFCSAGRNAGRKHDCDSGRKI